MTLLHIISSVNPAHGGPITGVLQQARMCRKHGIEMHIVCADSPDLPYVRDCPARVFALGDSTHFSWYDKTPWGRYGYEARLAPWLRQNIHRYRAVIVNGLWNYSTMAARKVLVDSGVPYAVFTHGMLDPWFKATYPVKNIVKQLFWYFCEGPLLNNANAVFFTTEDEKILSKDAFHPYRVKGKVVGFGTADVSGDKREQEAAFRARLPSLGDKRYLLYLSRIHPKKGVNILIEGFASIAHDYPDLDLVIAGPDQVGWQKELEELAGYFGVRHRIHWPGMLTGDEKWGAFRGCEAFALTSHQENFGVVVAEAMACGKAVLISDKVQIWREVKDHNAGIVKPDTAQGARELLQEFTALTRSQIDCIERNARELFEEKFDMAKVFFNINQAISEMMSEKPAPDFAEQLSTVE